MEPKLILVCSLKRNNQAELFEDNQRDLERAVENLGYSLEQNICNDVGAIAKLRQEITNQAVSLCIPSCARRLEADLFRHMFRRDTIY